MQMQENPTVPEASDAEVKEVVRHRYAALARSGVSSEGPAARQIAEAFGYSEDELKSIPAAANLGVSCGNPTALASLKEGEVVVDLGAGGGLDVFLAAQKVGPSGKAIGIDMTEDMIQRARRNADETGLTNVEFHLAEIESMPLPDDSVDCVISNCVLNLVPDKANAFAEIFRVLKPGGRLAVADLALKRELPPELAADFSAYVGCVAGAMLMKDYESALTAAGFDAVQIIDSGQDLNAYAKTNEPNDGCEPSSCCGTSPAETSVHQGLAGLLRKFDINQYAASVRVLALKPQ
jgi:SAM-dependent methyltransferase